MKIKGLFEELDYLLDFLTKHIKLIFKPRELVSYILHEPYKKLVIKSVVITVMNYLFFKFLVGFFSTEKTFHYQYIPVIIVFVAILYSLCFIFIFLSIKIRNKEKLKLAFFSSISFLVHSCLCISFYLFAFLFQNGTFSIFFTLLFIYLVLYIFLLYIHCISIKKII